MKGLLLLCVGRVIPMIAVSDISTIDIGMCLNCRYEECKYISIENGLIIRCSNCGYHTFFPLEEAFFRIFEFIRYLLDETPDEPSDDGCLATGGRGSQDL